RNLLYYGKHAPKFSRNWAALRPAQLSHHFTQEIFMTYKAIKFEIRDDGIATMTLDRPDALNCFNQEMFREWREVVEKAAYDRNIRVLVITGSGRAFSSGVDLNELGG